MSVSLRFMEPSSSSFNREIAMYNLPVELAGKVLKIALVGVGGSGSAMVKELIQLDTTLRALDPLSGLSVTLIDGSVVTQANIARQSFFPSQVGQNKAVASVWTANNLYAKKWEAYPHHLESVSMLQQFDIVITALDRPSVRLSISKSKGRFLWLDMGNNATQGQVVLGEVTGGKKKLPTICDLYDYSKLTDADADIKSCSAEESISRQQLGVNQFAARISGQLLWNLLRNGKIESNGAYFDVQALTVDPIGKADWNILGWNEA